MRRIWPGGISTCPIVIGDNASPAVPITSPCNARRRLNEGDPTARPETNAIAEANASGRVCSAAGCVGYCAIVLLLMGGAGLSRALCAHRYDACVTSSTTILQVDSSEWT